MVDLEIKVEGTDNINSRLHDKAEALRTGLGEALREVADLIVEEAQSTCPVDTGYLRDHIQITSESDTQVTVASTAEYSSFVEYGTRYMDAQPFFEPAIDKARSQMQQILKDAFANT